MSQYDIVFDWIPAVADVRRTDIPMSSSLILHYVLPANIRLNKFQNSDLLYLLCECKYVIWSCRNLKKFENRKVNGNFMVMFLLSRLKLRIRSDFKRMSLHAFSKYWVEPGVFCDVDDNGLILHIDI